MLDAKADREGFRFEEDPATFEHAQRVARAVSRARARRGDCASVSPFSSTAPSIRPSSISEIRDFALETDFAAERDDLRAHLLDDAREPERADVRLAHVQDFLRRARAHELVHHLAAVELRILDLAVELAVGEQARPTLAELHVGFRRQDILAPQRPGVLRAATHVAAALEHDGLEAHLREQQRGEQPAGPKPMTSGRSASAAGALATG